MVFHHHIRHVFIQRWEEQNELNVKAAASYQMNQGSQQQGFSNLRKCNDGSGFALNNNKVANLQTDLDFNLSESSTFGRASSLVLGSNGNVVQNMKLSGGLPSGVYLPYRPRANAMANNPIGNSTASGANPNPSFIDTGSNVSFDPLQGSLGGSGKTFAAQTSPSLSSKTTGVSMSPATTRCSPTNSLHGSPMPSLPSTPRDSRLPSMERGAHYSEGTLLFQILANHTNHIMILDEK
jgi:hypothetical protein